MNRACIFCGFSGKLTAEHVFGDWLNGLALGKEPTRGGAGPLNRSLRDLGVARPFGRTVKTVCGQCNNGWMSQLEVVAARALSALIVGGTATVELSDAAALTAWVQKTALVSMCMLSSTERATGGGLPTEECRGLYELRHQLCPLPDTQLWIAQYSGRQRLAAAYVTPMVVRIPGIEEPKQPHAYVATIVVGKVLLQCARFTTPALAFELSSDIDLGCVWPVSGAVEAPVGTPIDDEAFVRVAKGLNLGARSLPVALRPWTPATDLARSSIVGPFVQLPTPCCQGHVYYPTALVDEALVGVFYAFLAGCDCGVWHLVVTEADGAHFKVEAPTLNREIVAAYDRRDGEEVIFESEEATFPCKRLSSSPGVVASF
jgi:hypothetical protein